MEEEQPKKKKKPTISKEERLTVEKFKLILSSLTARSCQYAYIFPNSNKFIMANSTTPRAPNELKKDLIIDHEFHGDRMMNFMDGDLGVHLVEVWDPLFMKILRGLLGLDTMDITCKVRSKIFKDHSFTINPINCVWGVICSNFLSVISKYPLADLHLEFEVGMYGDIYTYLVPNGQRHDKKHLVTFNLINYHYEQLLYQYLERLPNLWEEVSSGKYPYIKQEIELKPILVGKSYKDKINFHEFKYPDGRRVFENCKDFHNVLHIDGLDTVSLKEFVKRILEEDFELDRYYWVAENHRVSCITRFRNTVVQVLSTRPNIQLTPIPSVMTLVKPEDLPVPTFS